MNKKKMMDEQTPLPNLIARSLQGDENAFRHLVEQHQGYVFALAFRLTCNHDDAMDIVQETFIKVWSHLPSYDARCKFTTWVYRIAVNLSYDRLKAKRRRGRWLFRLAVVEDQAASREDGAGANLENLDLAEKIRFFADHLPTKQRLVFILRDIQDFSVEEVAQILTMSTNAVKVNLCFARRSIRTKMMHLETIEGQHS